MLDSKLVKIKAYANRFNIRLWENMVKPCDMLVEIFNLPGTLGNGSVHFLGELAAECVGEEGWMCSGEFLGEFPPKDFSHYWIALV